VSEIRDHEELLRIILDTIEEKETKLLVWGLVDGRISRLELDDIIYPLLESALEQGVEDFYEAGEVIAALKSRGLLFESDDHPYSGFRSRMAETVRLAFRLRQLFPKHGSVDGWQNARTLVADYRFTRRPRRYPRRDLDPSELINRVGGLLDDPTQLLALKGLLNGRGDGYKLAEFQSRATERILGGLSKGRSNGTLVSAGTGSGKTLAFYLPAMARIGALRIKQGRGIGWTKLLAIYPRTELLRDQFSEIYGEARRLDDLMKSSGASKIRIGTLFGETPENASEFTGKKASGFGNRSKREKWRKVSEGRVCAYMSCPQAGCEGDLIWQNADMESSTERLHCAECGFRIDEDELVLTRESLRKNPPDILFTTTEMLNQRMSDTATRHVFGLRPGAIRPPEMVLLDEVHTYSGNHGAQVGYLLRRWRYLVRAPITFVGLSATLQDGARFFSRLTGLREQLVEEVAPRQTDMVSDGAEYILALRGDPVSRAALLSTTIQAGMLMMRAMDRSANEPSKGLYGQRVFAFTDDIDVTNRLYFGIQDAEGRNDRGEPDLARHPKGPLASLRRSMPAASRDRAGQNWRMVEEIGHPLNERKRIGRTSSQDPGVTRGLDLIVATASLEVGFNDPGVGCVIQHKAPRDAAQFLQRKGRAGRPRGMRPWTLVVLSDYGRDRFAYQGYESLFDPELRPGHLPFASRYIQRMQATYALIDFLAQELGPSLGGGSAWTALASPISKKKPWSEKLKARQGALVGLLARLIQDPQGLIFFEEHLRKSLQLPLHEVQPLLWHYPRPVLTTVIPTALRRISTNWRYQGQETSDFSIPNSPLPEFIPANLFSDLNLPELKVLLPPAFSGGNPELQLMGLEQGLRTFAPGRVSRRFGVQHSSVRHWIANVDAGREQANIEISDFYDAELVGTWLIRDSNGVSEVPVFRPFELRPVRPAGEIGDTSNARLTWKTQICVREPGIPLNVPSDSPWHSLLSDICCFRHAEHSAIEVRRFAVGSDADIRMKGEDGYQIRFDFSDDGRPAAVGYSLSVDALRIGINVPDNLWQQLLEDRDLERAIRTEQFFNPKTTIKSLPMVTNPFMRDWLTSIYFAALTQHALAHGVGLVEASMGVASNKSDMALKDVLESFFQSTKSSDNPEGPGQDDDNDQLRKDLESLLAESDVITGLQTHAGCLWEPIDETWEPLLLRRFVATVGAAAMEAVCDLCSEIDQASLVVDENPGPKTAEDLYAGSTGESEIWISETSPGGSGAIEEFLAKYNEDPRVFYSLLEAQLQPNEYFQTDFQLRRLLDSVAGEVQDEDLKQGVNAVRSAKSNSDTGHAMAVLRRMLSDKGYVLYHGFISALTTRVIRPGSTNELDNFLLRLANQWAAEENRLGVELDGRAIAYSWSFSDQVDQILINAGIPLPELDQRMTWRFNAIYGLLWRRGREVRRIGLEPYNPFCSLDSAERLLVSAHLPTARTSISVEDLNWREPALNRLSSFGLVTLRCALKEKQSLADALRFFAVNPVESQYLSVYARVTAFKNLEDHVEVDLEVAEVLG
jgi:hypothetical protein